MLRRLLSLLPLALVPLGCGTPAPQTAPQLINVHATSAASPWLNEVFDCASPSVAVKLSDPASAEINLRLGEPARLTAPAFQIGTEDVLVVVHPQTGVGSLTLDQVRQLFSGQVTQWTEVGGADLPVQVWVFSPAEDIQEIFDRLVMRGQPVTSLAWLAVSAQYMSDSVGSNQGSIGLLPRRWKAGNTREALAVLSVPILAITSGEPAGMARDLLSCLQSGK